MKRACASPPAACSTIRSARANYSAEQYLKSAEEMAALFADVPEALQNTVELAKRCNFELSLGTYYLPDFPVPEGYTLGSLDRSSPRDGTRTPPAKARDWRPASAAPTTTRGWRANSTSSMSMGFPGYFLIVADFINWAQGQRHPGRARAAVRAPARWWRGRWASPTSTRCATTCCSSASSIPNACRCPTSTSTSAWTAATR